MKFSLAFVAASALLLAGCGRNEPGTMGGEPGISPTLATGAPAEAAKHSVVSNPSASAIASEHGQSTYEPDGTNTRSGLKPPDASTKDL